MNFCFLQETRRTVKILKEEAGKFGLEVNMKKSKCTIFNLKGRGEEVQEIGGMEVVKEIKYLGVKIEGRCNLYEGQRRKMF